jgi:hypothetical protein
VDPVCLETDFALLVAIVFGPLTGAKASSEAEAPRGESQAAFAPA